MTSSTSRMLTRHGRSLRAGERPVAWWRGPHRGRRLLALAAAVAVPAMAAPGEWRSIDLLGSREGQPTAMAFETPGQSFPGSAFFYLEDVPVAPADGIAATDDAPPPPLATGARWDAETSATGTAARAFNWAGTGGVDKARALQCMTMAIYYEAANEPTDGQRAVAQVVLNRVEHPSFPNSVCGVVFQGSERGSGCQFSFTCDGSLMRAPMRALWDRARSVASAALAGYVYSPIGTATHYHATYVLPYWAGSLQNVGTIGLHTFYRWRGPAGASSAFAMLYRGNEPVAAPHPRSSDPGPDSAPDPVVLAQAYEAARGKALAAAASGTFTPPPPPPVYSAPVAARGGDRTFTAQDLPVASGVKAEYANSGRWIAQPAG